MNRIILTLCIITSSTFLLQAQSNNENAEYDYISLTVDKTAPKIIYLSYSTGEYEKLKLDSKGAYDYSGVFRIINEKEKLGYELFSNNLSIPEQGSVWTYQNFILRKRKN